MTQIEDSGREGVLVREYPSRAAQEQPAWPMRLSYSAIDQVQYRPPCCGRSSKK